MTEEERKRKIDAMRRFVPNDAGPMGPIGPSSQQTKKKSYWALPDNAANPMTWVKGVGRAAMDNFVEPMYDTFSGNNFRKYANPRSGQSIPQRLVGLGSDILNIGSVIPAVKGLAMAPEAIAATRAGRALANRQAMKEFGSFMDNVSPYEFNKWDDFAPRNKPVDVDITDDLAELDNLQPDDFITSLEDQGFTKPTSQPKESRATWEPEDYELRQFISDNDLVDIYMRGRNQASYHKRALASIDKIRDQMMQNPDYLEMSQAMTRYPRVRGKLINNFNKNVIDDLAGAGEEYFYPRDVREFNNAQKADDLLADWIAKRDDKEIKMYVMDQILRNLGRR